MNRKTFDNFTAFKKWCLTKGSETYNYFDRENCIFSQWAKKCGAKKTIADGFGIFIDDVRHDLPKFYPKIINKIRLFQPVTFSSVVE